MIAVLGVCHPAVEADVSPGPSGVGVTFPVPASRGQSGGMLGEGAVRKGRGRLGSTNPQALDWGWREAERASRAPQYPVPSDRRLLPYTGCRSNAQAAGMGAASTCPKGWRAQRALPQAAAVTPDPRGTRASTENGGAFFSGMRRVPAGQAGSEVPVGQAPACPPQALSLSSPRAGIAVALTFSLCWASFSSPSTCRSFLATPTQGKSVRTPRWQATPKPTGQRVRLGWRVVSPAVRRRCRDRGQARASRVSPGRPRPVGRLSTEERGAGEPPALGRGPLPSRVSGWGGRGLPPPGEVGGQIRSRRFTPALSHFLALSILFSSLWPLSGLSFPPNSFLGLLPGMAHAVTGGLAPRWHPRVPGPAFLGPSAAPPSGLWPPTGHSGVSVPGRRWVQSFPAPVGNGHSGLASVGGLSLPEVGRVARVGQARWAAAGQRAERACDGPAQSARGGPGGSDKQGGVPTRQACPGKRGQGLAGGRGPGAGHRHRHSTSALVGTAPSGPGLSGAGLPRWWRTPFPSTRRTWKSHR